MRYTCKASSGTMGVTKSVSVRTVLQDTTGAVTGKSLVFDNRATGGVYAML